MRFRENIGSEDIGNVVVVEEGCDRGRIGGIQMKFKRYASIMKGFSPLGDYFKYRQGPGGLGFMQF